MLAFSADRKSLAEAIIRASQGISSRPQNPVHAGMLITSTGTGILHLTASDGDVTFTASCDAAITDSGSCILPGRMLAEISRYFTGDAVILEEKDTTAVITTGKSSFTLSSSPGGKFPSWEKSPQVLGKLDAEVFTDAVKSLYPAVSRIHPVMRGIRMELEKDKLLMTATDGSRMAFASPSVSAVSLRADVLSPAAILAPGIILERFSRVAEGEVSFGWSGNLLGLWTQGLEMVTPQIAGEFHKSWVMIREDHPPYVTAPSAELAVLVKMAALAAGDQGRVSLEFEEKGGDGILVVSASGDAGYSGVLETTGYMYPRQLEFTPSYLLDGISGEVTQFSWTGRALLMETSGTRTLVQPRRKMTIGAS